MNNTLYIFRGWLWFIFKVPKRLTNIVRLTALMAACSVQGQATSLQVYSQVVCYSNGVCQPLNSDLTTQKSASGVRIDANCPPFCYRITVTNSGTVPLTLTVSDDSRPDPDLSLNACGFPPVLPAGATAQCIIPAVTYCQDTVNVVTAIGVTDSGQTVTARDTNFITVSPIAIGAALQISTDGGASFFDPGVNCAELEAESIIIVRISVYNSGQFPLDNVILTGVASLCFPTPLNIGRLNVGETKTNLCTIIPCSVPATNNVRVNVSAESSQAFGSICDFNSQGQRIIVRNSLEVCMICNGPPDIIQLSRGIPKVNGGLRSQRGPQLQTSCGLSRSNALWFRLVKDASYPEGIADLSTVGSDYDTILMVYSGPISSPANLTLVACNDDMDALSQQSRVTFRFPASSLSDTHWLVVSSKGGNNGNFRLVVGYEPQLESYGFNSSNQFELRSSVAPPLPYQLQSTSNLVAMPSDWRLLTTVNLPTSGYFIFVDTNAADFAQRFYRIVPSP